MKLIFSYQDVAVTTQNSFCYSWKFHCNKGSSTRPTTTIIWNQKALCQGIIDLHDQIPKTPYLRFELWDARLGEDWCHQRVRLTSATSLSRNRLGPLTMEKIIITHCFLSVIVGGIIIIIFGPPIVIFDFKIVSGSFNPGKHDDFIAKLKRI